jgi:hypothetical protein
MNFIDNNEAWLVVDKAQWTEEQLNQPYQWAKPKNNYEN